VGEELGEVRHQPEVFEIPNVDAFAG